MAVENLSKTDFFYDFKREGGYPKNSKLNKSIRRSRSICQ